MKVKFFLLLTLLCVPALAQESARMGVVFNCQCDDSVGKIYASTFRDLLAKSPRYFEAYVAQPKGSDGKPAAYNWQIRVISMDPSTNNNGEQSVMSIAYLLGNDIFLTQEVQWCPVARTETCAKSEFSDFDNYLSNLGKK